MNFKNWALASLMCICTAAFAQYKPAYSVVKSNSKYVINRDASYTQYLEEQTRVDTPQGVRMLGERKISYNSTLEDVEVLEAYTIQPDGTRIAVPLDKIRTQDDVEEDGAIYSDSKSKVIIYPKLEVGSQVYYRAKSVLHTPQFPGHFFMWEHYSPHVRYESVNVELTHDVGIEVGVSNKGMQGGKLEASSLPNTVSYKFTFSQDKVYPGEESRADLADFAPNFSASTFKTYADVGTAYQVRAKDMAKVTPTIQTLANDLIQKANAQTTLDKVKVLHHWVAQNIRYLGIYVGAGGYVPHDAQSILDNRYGDCKDHVVILEALLAAVGIDSSPALINSSAAYLLPQLPTPGIFDHVITYVPSLNLFLDSTSRFAPVGTLPNGDLDKPVVIAATGALGRTPMTHPSKDRTESRIQMKLTRNGSIEGKSQAKMWGAFEVASRHSQFNYQNKDQANVVNGLLSRFQETGWGEIEKTDPTNFDKAWQVKAVFELDPVVNVPGPSALAIPVGLAPGRMKYLADIVLPKDRKFPTYCASTQHEEWIELSFPKDMKITRVPKGVSFANGPLKYQSTYELKGQLLKIKRKYVSERKQSICGAENDKWFSEFTQVLRRDLRQQVFFE
jgi:transglutaminase-like putative cysteine protease